MSLQLEKKVDNIKVDVLKMSYLVRDAIDEAVKALTASDEVLARKVVEGDLAINNMLKEIDQEIISFQALEQPVAKDLRFSITSTRVVILLEHIGDQALAMAEHVVSMVENHASLPPCPFLDKLAKLTSDMYLEAVQLYNDPSDRDFQHFAELDARAAEYTTNILRFYVSYMIEEDRVVERAIKMIIISRCLKSICDYAMNMVENILFVVKGLSVDHVCHPV
jgi:phosphate transport system protein